MSKIVLITGGSRSGKSAYAQRLGESLRGPRAYIATCPIIDDEIRDRIQRHRTARAAGDWETIEETLGVAGVIERSHSFTTILVECVTLWINNLMYADQLAGRESREDEVAVECHRLVEAARRHPGVVIFVTNEVGMGIVPDNQAARTYRDLVGRANQVIAGSADVVTFMSCGLPLHLKGSHESLA